MAQSRIDRTPNILTASYLFVTIFDIHRYVHCWYHGFFIILKRFRIDEKQRKSENRRAATSDWLTSSGFLTVALFDANFFCSWFARQNECNRCLLWREKNRWSAANRLQFVGVNTHFDVPSSLQLIKFISFFVCKLAHFRFLYPVPWKKYSELILNISMSRLALWSN